jgi:hypothetical protein
MRPEFRIDRRRAHRRQRCFDPQFLGDAVSFKGLSFDSVMYLDARLTAGLVPCALPRGLGVSAGAPS